MLKHLLMPPSHLLVPQELLCETFAIFNLYCYKLTSEFYQNFLVNYPNISCLAFRCKSKLATIFSGTSFTLVEQSIVEIAVRKELCEVIAIEGEVSVMDLTVLSEGCAMALGVETST